MEYFSGEEIKAGDRITYHGEPGNIEFIVAPDDPSTGWYAEQYGSGCMLVAAGFGHVFLAEPHEDEDMEFISRAPA